MASQNAGNIYGEIRIQLERLQRDLNEAQSMVAGAVGEMEEVATEAGNTFTNMSADTRKAFKVTGAAVTGAGVLIGKVLKDSAGVAMDFEASMSKVGSVSGAVGDEMDDLRKLALKMGKDTVFSAKESAEGMFELSKAGISVKDILGGGMEGALALAAAGQIELADAAEIASSAINSFQLSGKQLPHVADVFAGVANNSATSVGEMKYSFSQVSVMAAQMGMSLEDTALAIGVLAKSGVKGGDAGTSLKTMLARLVPTTDAAAKKMQQLGWITEDNKNRFFDAQGNLKGLNEIMEIMNGSMDKLTAEERQKALYEIFGSDAIRAAGALYSQGAEGLEQLSKAMEGTKAADVAEEQLDNLSGTLRQLEGSMETAKIAFSGPLLPLIRELAEGVRSLVDWYLALDPVWQSVITYAIATVGVLALIIGPILLLIGFLPAIVEGFAMVGTVLSVLAGVFTATVGWIIAIAAAVIALGVIIYKNWDAIKTWTVNAFSAMIEWLKAVPENAKAFGKWLITDLPMMVATGFGAMIKWIWETHLKVKEWVKKVPEMLWEGLKNLVATIIDWAPKAFKAWVEFWGSLRTELIEFLKELPAMIADAFDKAINAIGGMVDKAKTKAKDFASNLWSGFKKGLGIHSPSYIEEAMFDIQDETANTVDHLKQGFSTLGNMSVKPKVSYDSLESNMKLGTGGVVNHFNAPLVSAQSLRVDSDDRTRQLSRDLASQIVNKSRANGVVMT